MTGADRSWSDLLGRRLSRRALLKAGAVSGLGLGLWGCAPRAAPSAPQAQQQEGPRRGGTLRLNLMTENPPTLDPYLNVSYRTKIFSGFVYSRLLKFKYGPNIGANAFIPGEPDLAERYEVSQDGTTWTFYLRKNARWHNKPPLNGRPVTAQDVVWAFNRFMKESPERNVFAQVADVKPADDYTVQFKLNRPWAPFLTNISSYFFWVVPREVVEQYGDASKIVVGSGPFMLENFESGVSFTFTRNPDYYEEGRPYVDKVIGLIIPDTATAMAALRAREVDMAGVNPQDLENFKQTVPDAKIYQWEYLLIPFMYWRADKPPFNDPRVRQAVSMAIDRDEILKVVYNGEGGWNNFIPWALQSWWLDPKSPEMGPAGKYFKYDPRAARELLAAAGYPNGLKTVLISTPGYGTVWVQYVELIHAQLKRAGFDVELRMQEYSAYISTTFLGKFEEGMVWGLQTPFQEPHDFLFGMFHSKGNRNHAHINDPTLDQMVDKQAETLNIDERRRLIFDIQRYAADKMYYVPGSVPYVYWAVHPYIGGYYPYSTTEYGYAGTVLTRIWLNK
jgi:peptide/nickel transport system substrate-binding protein